MSPDNFGDNISRHNIPDRPFDDDDMKPILVKPYQAWCRFCGEMYPYHPTIFRKCPNLNCPRPHRR